MNKAANKTQEVVMDLQNKIIVSALKPFDKLMPLRDLAKEYQASRSVVNSAIQVLSTKGYVSVVPRQGVIVNDILHDGTIEVLKDIFFSDNALLKSLVVKDVFQTRMMAELEAIKLITQKEKVDFSNLELIADKEKEWLKTEHHSIETLCELDHEFHAEIISLSGNKVLRLLYRSFQEIEKSLIRSFYENQQLAPGVIKTHQDLLICLKERDYDKSSCLWEKVLSQGEKETLAKLQI